MASESVSPTPLNESHGNGTAQSSHSVDHDLHVILSLSVAFAVGALLRHAFKRTPLPYTVILLLFGVTIGGLARVFEPLRKYTAMAHMDPHQILFIFLPLLIFESAFAMDVHTFKKTFVQVVLLAGPGLGLCTVLTGLIGRFIFTYGWGWMPSMMFGCILSATDPVAVVALLRELGASKQLSTLIEGESLLNDGAAIVLFEVFKAGSIPGGAWSAGKIAIYFVRVVFGGPAFGFVMGKLSVFWLSRVFNDALVEITITLASTYVTFYIGEKFLKVSGVLAVVVLGIEINSRKTNISPEVEVFLHRFWEMMGYLANTMIFILVGVVIMERAFSNVDSTDVIFLFSIYFGVMVIRGIVLGLMAPIMARLAYGLSSQSVCVMVWGGLRGAVGLTLALLVSGDKGINEKMIGDKVLFHTAGIVLFTLIINATTVKPLLKLLGMSEMSTARRLTLAAAIRRIREAAWRTMSVLKEDRFLCDANWEVVETATHVKDPFKTEDVEFIQDHMDVNGGFTSQCPSCDTTIPPTLKPKELAEMAEEARLRYIKAEKTSYWKQFAHGMLGREAVRTLQAVADSAMDDSEKLIGLKDLEHTWRVPTVYKKLRDYVHGLHQRLSQPADEIPPPLLSCQVVVYRFVKHPAFDWTILGLILVNVVVIIVELAAPISDDAKAKLKIVNYVFCSIYLVEIIFKAIGYRIHYVWPIRKTVWNWFDIVIVGVAVIDILIDQLAPEEDNSTKFEPAILRVAKGLRIVRVSRILRMTKFFFPFLLNIIDNIVNRHLSLGYDIGKGFVMAEDDVGKHISQVVEHRETAVKLKLLSDKNRQEVTKSIAMLRKEHPGIAISVKTRHAIRSVWNQCKEVVDDMRSDGLLDEGDSERLNQLIEVGMKRQQNAPSYMNPSPPEKQLRQISWLQDAEEQVLDRIVEIATLVEYEQDQSIIAEGDDGTGIYLIVSGLVKITSSNKSTFGELKALVHTSTDYLGSGSVMGEMSLLTDLPRNATVVCETPVQAFFINSEDIRAVMDDYPFIEDHLWRVCGVRIAHTMLIHQPDYQDLSTQELRFFCEWAYVADVNDTNDSETFTVDETMKEIILINGSVLCLPSRETISAPAVIPSGSKFVIFKSKGGGGGEGERELPPPKLLVIPRTDFRMTQKERSTSSTVPENPFDRRYSFGGRRFSYSRRLSYGRRFSYASHLSHHSRRASMLSRRSVMSRVQSRTSPHRGDGHHHHRLDPILKLFRGAKVGDAESNAGTS